MKACLFLAALPAILIGCGSPMPDPTATQGADFVGAIPPLRAVAPLHRARPPISRRPGPGLTADAGSTPDAGSDAQDGGPEPLPPACPTDRTCRIMPLGDSITDGGTSGAIGYRPPLWHLMREGGMSATFVGSLVGGPDLVDGQPWPRNHEGHSGWSIDAVGSVMTGLQVIAADRITSFQPDAVLLMIGTNDVQLDFDLANAPARLTRLIDTIVAAKPDAAIFLATILPTQDPAQNVKVDAFNAAIPGIVAAQQAAGRNVTLVDQHAAFAANPNFATEWLADRLHPTDPGYAVLASNWFNAL